MCLGSCQRNSRIWGVTSESGKRLYRLTFSKSLADIICKDSRYRLRRFSVLPGKALQLGEPSPTGIYLVCARATGVVLRASLLRDVAALHANDPSRQLFAGILTGVHSDETKSTIDSRPA